MNTENNNIEPDSKKEESLDKSSKGHVAGGEDEGHPIAGGRSQNVESIEDIQKDLDENDEFEEGKNS